ncbi:MAG: sulfatase-like hydrolase/transferase [Bacteroidales bacterium]|nr:sulfatase-like hydrolase/transferase [Bacteroidales bacterium]
MSLKKLICLSVILTAGLINAQETTQKPNILIILADDLGYADVGFNGSDIQTPNIDRIASGGIRFDNFYACPMCSPTRAGLLTGRYPIRFGMMRAVVPPQRIYGMNPEEVTLAEMLASAGYKHRGVVGKWHLGHRHQKWWPNNQGFTFFEGCLNGAIDYFSHEREGENDWHLNGKTHKKEGYATDLIGEASCSFINDIPANEPFFLYTSFTAPHSPFQAKKEDLKKYPHREGKKKTYAAMVDCMDQNIGKILDCIEERGQMDNTFILFFSDNGGMKSVANNGQKRGWKLTVYEGGINVVATACWPSGGVAGGRVISEHVGYIDVFPTLAEISGYEKNVKYKLDGMSMLNAMKGERMPKRKWFTYLDQNNEKVERLTIHSDNLKLVWYRNAPDNKVQTSRIELYNTTNDKGETDNVADKYPLLVEELQQQTEAFYKLKIERQNPRYYNNTTLSGPVIPEWQAKE